jgi:hypothetical protein
MASSSTKSSWLLNVNNTRSIAFIALVCVIMFFQVYRESSSSGHNAGLEQIHQQITIAHTNNINTNKGKNALVYAGPTFHEEVTASVTCVLKTLGYDVTVYIHTGIYFAGMQIPFSSVREHSSRSLYGSCVDTWIHAGDGKQRSSSYLGDKVLNNVPTSSIDIVVFITFPAILHASTYGSWLLDIILGAEPSRKLHTGNDPIVMDILNTLHSNKYTGSLTLISHAHNATSKALKMLDSFPRSQITFLFLSEHSRQSEIERFKENVQTDTNTTNPFFSRLLNESHFDFFIPVFTPSFASSLAKTTTTAMRASNGQDNRNIRLRHRNLNNINASTNTNNITKSNRSTMKDGTGTTNAHTYSNTHT